MRHCLQQRELRSDPAVPQQEVCYMNHPFRLRSINSNLCLGQFFPAVSAVTLGLGRGGQKEGPPLLLLRPLAFGSKSGQERDTRTCEGHGSVELIF